MAMSSRSIDPVLGFSVISSSGSDSFDPRTVGHSHPLLPVWTNCAFEEAVRQGLYHCHLAGSFGISAISDESLFWHEIPEKSSGNQGMFKRSSDPYRAISKDAIVGICKGESSPESCDPDSLQTCTR